MEHSGLASPQGPGCFSTPHRALGVRQLSHPLRVGLGIGPAEGSQDLSSYLTKERSYSSGSCSPGSEKAESTLAEFCYRPFPSNGLVPPPPTRTQFQREEAVPALEGGGWGGGRQRGGAEPGGEGAERGNEAEGGAGRGSEAGCYLLVT